MEDLSALARLIQGIAPWRAHLVIVGGWAHRLYRLHPLASVPDYQPLVTRDTDLAFAADAPLVGDIRDSLRNQGFEEELTGDDQPPVTHYTLGDDDAGFYAEFLTPLMGSETKNGKRDVTTVRAGITAQKLRFLEILLTDPWTVTLGAGRGVPIEKPVDINIANPVSLIAQKLLIHDRRKATKRAQDVLYIHDTLQLFGGHLEELASLWNLSVKPSLAPRAARNVIRLSTEMFADVTDTIRDAAQMPQDRKLNPDLLRRSCGAALNQILT